MFERFTSRARAIMVLAQVESRALNHAYIGTEHILLGLIHEGEGVAAEALKSLDISLEAVRSQVEEIIGSDKAMKAPSGHIPFTPRAKKVLELSLREALQLGHNYIGTEHILLGLIREGEGVAAQVLIQQGADHDRVRAQVIRLLAARESAEPAPVPESRLGRLLRPSTIGAARPTSAGDVSLLDALEAISERLAGIEARLGIAGQHSGGRAELEREVARLGALLRQHGIDPEVGQAADPGEDPAAGQAADPEASQAVAGRAADPGENPEPGQAAAAGEDSGADLAGEPHEQPGVGPGGPLPSE
jgi:ATP-dependent Clp protease ATP-binding subunit ClpA